MIKNSKWSNRKNNKMKRKEDWYDKIYKIKINIFLIFFIYNKEI